MRNEWHRRTVANAWIAAFVAALVAAGALAFAVVPEALGIGPALPVQRGLPAADLPCLGLVALIRHVENELESHRELRASFEGLYLDLRDLSRNLPESPNAAASRHAAEVLQHTNAISNAMGTRLTHLNGDRRALSQALDELCVP